VAAVAILALSAVPAHAAGRCGNHPWCDTSLSPERRAELLLAALTPDEKYSLMNGDDLAGVATGNPATGTSDGVPRLDVPTIYYSDGPVGTREGQSTAMPAPISLASAFDSALARRVGVAIADEVRKKGNDVVHAPTVDIMRTPLAGRTFEGYGEDPWLSSRLAVRWIEGAQSQGVIGNVKHFAPNSQEGAPPGAPPLASAVGGRFIVDARVDPRTLREIYLPAFEAAVKEAKVGTIMCAYNRLNGSPACENRELLDRILRREWGFDGFVVADYGFATKSTAASANNGLELDMPQGFFYSQPNLATAVATGQVSSATIDLRVGNILRTLFRFGAFDRADYPANDGLIDKPAHDAVAREVEERGMVLLRNRGMLPLNASRLKSIAVIGAVADAYKGGGGSSAIRPFSFSSPRAEIARRAGPGVQVRYDPGDDPQRAAAVARGADVALVFAADTATEGVDKTSLATDDDPLVEAVAAANPRTTVVLETAGPVLTPWRERVNAIVEAWYPGQAAGRAIARVLFGDTDPGGRLPATFPRRMQDVPTTGDREAYPGLIEVKFKEGIFVGYRHYDQHGLEPAYPFGHGLSYTSFAYRGLRIRKGRGDSAAVSVEVRNTGRRTGSDVAQLYLGLPDVGAAIKQPPRALKGARKLTLRPGQRRRVGFRLDPRALSYWHEGARRWRVAAGCYGVQVGRSSRDIRLRGTLAIRTTTCPAPRSCLSRRSPIGPRNIGRIRLGLTRSRLASRIGPSRRGRLVTRWCVKRSRGRVSAVFGSRSSRSRALLVVTTARGHGNRRVRVGSSARALRRSYPRLRRVSRGVYRANPSSPRLFGVRRGRVRFIAVAGKRLLRSPRSLRRTIARAGL
jgi:beta-glucosidase